MCHTKHEVQGRSRSLGAEVTFRDIPLTVDWVSAVIFGRDAAESTLLKGPTDVMSSFRFVENCVRPGYNRITTARVCLRPGSEAANRETIPHCSYYRPAILTLSLTSVKFHGFLSTRSLAKAKCLPESFTANPSPIPPPPPAPSPHGPLPSE